MGGTFARHFAILSGGTAVNMLISILTTPIITRLVEPTSYGTYSLFFLYGNIALAVFGLGLDQSLARFFYCSESDEEKASLLRYCYVLPNLVFGLASLVLVVLALCFNIVSLSNMTIVLLFIIYVFALIINRNASVVLRLEFKSKQFALASILNKALFACLAIALLLFAKGLNEALALCACCTAACYAVAIYEVVVGRKLWFRSSAVFSKGYSKMSVLRYGLPFVVSGMAVLFMSGYGQISLESAGLFAEVGVYAAAVSLAGIFSIIQTSFNTIWLPFITQKYETGDHPFEYVERACNLVSLTMFSIGLVVILLKDVLVLFLGPEYRSAATIFPLLCFQPILYTISETTACGMVFAKKSGYQSIVGVLSCLINVITCSVLVPSMGMYGAALGAAVAYLSFFILRTFFSQLAVGHPLDFLKLSVSAVLFVAFALIGTQFETGLLLFVVFCLFQLALLLCYRNELGELGRLLRGFAQRGL